MIRILITGNTGQLGKSLIDIKPDNCEIITPNKNDLDLSNSKQCTNIINEIKPDWLINCAAFTNVDAAETKKDLTMKINASHFTNVPNRKYSSHVWHYKYNNY